jgi:CBS-domain-containing membrane protein
MKMANLVRHDVTSCSIHDNLDRAAQLMWDRDIGCLPVIDDQGHVAGMVTDRDVCMAAYTQGLPLRAIPVTTAMAKHVFSCGIDDELESVERTMSEHQIRRMPVIDDQGHPVGIVSLNDLARAATLGKVPASEITSTLAAVSAPRTLLAMAT